MADYIDRQEVINSLERLWDYNTVDGITASTVLRQVKTDILNVPSADVVEVVRCKDCKWYGTNDELCLLEGMSMSEEDYCSYGERKDG